MPYQIIVKRDFSAAHFLREYRGNCEKLHGHNYIVKVCCEKDTLAADGMVMDFKLLKQNVDAVLDTLDHGLINNVPPFDKQETTSEFIAAFIFQQVKLRLAPGPAGLPTAVRLKYVSVFETEDSEAVYYER